MRAAQIARRCDRGRALLPRAGVCQRPVTSDVA
jgi:hypothetical protein